ncbi:MAG: hypothetical protein KDD40_12935, partial [Bdellovibrionales bacterium]|nr:hypothetical protein [Bdellovibrionales bacterium]
HSHLWYIPGFYEAFRQDAVAINAAIELVVAGEGVNKGQYKYRICQNGKTQIEYYFRFSYPAEVHPSLPKEFSMPISDIYLQNLSVVYKKDYKYIANFLKTLDIDLSVKEDREDSQYSYNFSDIVIWPNKQEFGVGNKYKLKADDPLEQLPSFVQIPTTPFVDKAGPKEFKNYRLRAWGPFNSIHYVSSGLPVDKTYDIHNLYDNYESPSLKKALAEYHGDHFHRIESSCNFMFLLKDYNEKIKQKVFSRKINGEVTEYQCSLQPTGVNMGIENPNDFYYCPRLQWGDLYGPNTGNHETHFYGFCSDYRGVREDLLNWTTKEKKDYDPVKTNVFIENIRHSGATIVANDYLDLFYGARDHWLNHKDHIHVCFDPKEE